MAVESIGLSETHLEHFSSHGYVVVEDVLDPTRDFEPLLADYSELINQVARAMLSRGEIADYDPLGSLQQRLIERLHIDVPAFLRAFRANPGDYFRVARDGLTLSETHGWEIKLCQYYYSDYLVRILRIRQTSFN